MRAVRGLPAIGCLRAAWPDGVRPRRTGAAHTAARMEIVVKKTSLTLLLVALIALAAAQGQVAVRLDAPATRPAPAASQPASAPAPELAEYAAMIEAAKPTPEQLAQLTEKAVARRKALAGYLKEAGTAWGKAMTDSTKAPDANARETAAAKVREFQDMFDALKAAEEANVLSVLTPRQRLAWEESLLIAQMTARFSRRQVGHDAGGAMAATVTPPTAAQMKVIRELCAKAAKELQALKDPCDARLRRPIIDKLAEEIAKRSPPPDASGSQEK